MMVGVEDRLRGREDLLLRQGEPILADRMMRARRHAGFRLSTYRFLSVGPTMTAIVRATRIRLVTF